MKAISKMLTVTLSIIFLALSLPFLVQAGRNRNLFASRPNFTRLRRAISAPTVPTKKDATSRPNAKRRATEGDGVAEESAGASAGAGAPVLTDTVMEEPEEDEGMISDTSVESYVRFGRGMTIVDEKIGGGVVRSSVPRH